MEIVRASVIDPVPVVAVNEIPFSTDPVEVETDFRIDPVGVEIDFRIDLAGAMELATVSAMGSETATTSISTTITGTTTGIMALGITVAGEAVPPGDGDWALGWDTGVGSGMAMPTVPGSALGTAMRRPGD